MSETKSTSRSMPSNPDAERAVLSSVLRDNRVLAQVGDLITQEDFHLEAHRLIFAALETLSDGNQTLDSVTLAEELHRRGALDKVGGPKYIGDIIDYVGTTSGVKSYAQIVRDKAQLRRMIRAATEVATEGFASTLDTQEYLDRAERRIFEVRSNTLSSQGSHIKDVLKDTVKTLERIAESSGQLLGLTSGYKGLDDLLLGLHPSDLVIVAARPAMGKTAFAMNLALNAAIQGDAAVVVFSLEMSREQLASRILASEARVGLTKIRLGKLSGPEWTKVGQAVHKITETRVFLDDTPALSLPELRAKARRLKLEDNCDMVVVDYLQLMRSGKDLQSREQEISEISRGLKALAKELNIPVLALSQLNRGLEQRSDKRPVLSDLRESGAIEQDADVIMFIYRDEVYNPKTEHENLAELIVGKQRNGPTGTIKLNFFGSFTRFDSRHDSHIPVRESA